MMTIKSIKATNFKSFSKVEIKDFLPLNFIFGFNNSGKSNLLKLIETIFSRKLDPSKVTYETGDGKTTREIKTKGNFWEGVIERHGFIFRFGNLTTDIKFEVTIDFESEKTPGLTLIADLVKAKAIKKSGLNSMTLVGHITALGDYDAQQLLDSITINNKLVYSGTSSPLTDLLFKLLERFNDSVLFIDYDRYLKTEIENSKILDLTSGQFRNWLFNLSLSNDQNKEFNRILSSAREFKVDTTDNNFKANELSNPFNNNFEYRFARENDLIDIIFKNKFGEIPLSSFGTGIQQIIYLIFKIYETTPKILLLEEIELNLSPKYQDILIKYFEKLIADTKISQAFITSHSPLNCYRSQHRSMIAKINNKGETSIDKFVLNTADQKELTKAHKFLIKSVYGID